MSAVKANGSEVVKTEVLLLIQLFWHYLTVSLLACGFKQIHTHTCFHCSYVIFRHIDKYENQFLLNRCDMSPYMQKILNTISLNSWQEHRSIIWSFRNLRMYKRISKRDWSRFQMRVHKKTNKQRTKPTKKIAIIFIMSKSYTTDIWSQQYSNILPIN